jgi:hypothetical protein
MPAAARRLDTGASAPPAGIRPYHAPQGCFCTGTVEKLVDKGVDLCPEPRQDWAAGRCHFVGHRPAKSV